MVHLPLPTYMEPTYVYLPTFITWFNVWLILKVTLPETNSSPMKIPMFPCKYHQNGGFSMAMLVLGR